jgi:hypothetical protein
MSLVSSKTLNGLFSINVRLWVNFNPLIGLPLKISVRRFLCVARLLSCIAKWYNFEVGCRAEYVCYSNTLPSKYQINSFCWQMFQNSFSVTSHSFPDCSICKAGITRGARTLSYLLLGAGRGVRARILIFHTCSCCVLSILLRSLESKYGSWRIFVYVTLIRIPTHPHKMELLKYLPLLQMTRNQTI